MALLRRTNKVQRTGPPSRCHYITRTAVVCGDCLERFLGSALSGRVAPGITPWGSHRSGSMEVGVRLGFCGFAGSGRFPVFATCPMVILAHSPTTADQGGKKASLCEVHSLRRTSSTASSPCPIEDSHRALATKTRMGRKIVGWWCRPQPRKECSSPTLASPGGSTPNI